MPLHLGKLETVRKLKQKKKHKGTITYPLYQSLKASLGSGQRLREAVRVPPGQNPLDWIAMNTIELYNTTLLCYGVVADYCTVKSCPRMTAGRSTEYLWGDDKGSKPRSVSAPEYIDLLADWIYKQLSDPTIFPPQGSNYGKTFEATCKKILRRLIRVFAHLYHSHWHDVEQAGAEPHTNTCFKHFYYFVSQFNLLSKDDFLPLRDLITKIEQMDK